MDLEQDLIAEFLNFQKVSRSDVVCHSGDDAAVVSIPDGYVLVSTVDSQIQGTHFDDNFHPEDIGYKSLAVNLSDIAAMGAKPCWALVSLTLDKHDKFWVQSFSRGFCGLAVQHGIECVGGNIAKGVCGVHVTLMGIVKKESMLLQSTAKINDNILVTGEMGGQAYLYENSDIQNIDKSCWLRPSIQVDFAQAISGYVSAAVDVSDGLLIDLKGLLHKSKVGADLYLDSCPYHSFLQRLDKQYASNLAWTGGESYQLCFTCSDMNLAKVQSFANQFKVKLSLIGKVIEGSNVNWSNSITRVEPVINSFQHFSS